MVNKLFGENYFFQYPVNLKSTHQFKMNRRLLFRNQPSINNNYVDSSILEIRVSRFFVILLLRIKSKVKYNKKINTL